MTPRQQRLEDRAEDRDANQQRIERNRAPFRRLPRPALMPAHSPCIGCPDLIAGDYPRVCKECKEYR